MMRQNSRTHNSSHDRIKETSIDVARTGDIELKVSSAKLTSWHLGPRLARVARHFIPALLIALMVLGAPSASQASISVGVSVLIAPPPLVVYEQPVCPGPGFIWTPGYWAWGPDGYFWVPGTWVLAPYPGELWTPGYWAYDWDNDDYFWNEGYWGPEVGFYGGVVYGFGYTGFGYYGGYWSGRTYYYNTAVNNLNTTNITTVYNRPVNMSTTSTTSFNGGPGGITARPTSTQLTAANLRHDPPVSAQRQQLQAARTNRAQLASINNGAPPVAATPKPGAFSGSGVVRATHAGGPVNLATNRTAGNRGAARNANPRSGIQPMNPTRPNEAAPMQPAGRSTRPAIRIPQSNPGHATPQRSEPNIQRVPQSTERSQPAGRRMASPITSPAERPQSNPGRSASPRAEPRQQPVPHAAPQQRPAPHPKGEPHAAMQRMSSPHAGASRAVAQHRSRVPAHVTTRTVAQRRTTARPQGRTRTIAQHRTAPARGMRTVAQQRTAISPAGRMRTVAQHRMAPARGVTRTVAQHRTVTRPHGTLPAVAQRRTMAPVRSTTRAVAQQRTSVPAYNAKRAQAQERSMPRMQSAPRAVAQERSMSQRQSVPRAVAPERSMPRPQSAPPRAMMPQQARPQSAPPAAAQQRGAPQPRAGQRQNPHSPHGGR